MIKILRSLSISLFFGLSLGFVACSGKPDVIVEPPPPPPPPPEWTVTPEADVYIVGNHNMVMKNGKIIHYLEKGDFPMYAYSVFVYGGDVYVAGHRRDNDRQLASLWKNGKLQPLELFYTNNPNHLSSAISVFVSDDNVYVAGYQPGSNGFSVATLWVNGVPTSLSDPDTDSYLAEAKSVFVSDGDVYVGGYEGFYFGIVWKNGEVLYKYRYSDGHSDYGRATKVYSIFVSNGDVYAAVYDWIDVARFTFWKNDEPHNLGLGGPGCVFVSGDDVYVAGSKAADQNDIFNVGFKSHAVLWKNGVEHRLTDGKDYAFVDSISVSGDNVYLAGAEYELGKATAILWVNGEAINLRPYGFTTGYATSVYAVSKTD